MRKIQRNIIYINNDSDAEDTTIYIDVNGNDSDKSDTTDTNSQFLSKIKSVLKSTIFNNGEAKLNIRYRFSFVDFCNLFTKILNKPKLNMMYRVHLNGEARQDDGELSGEFDSGMRSFNGVCEHLMTFDTNILLPSDFNLTLLLLHIPFRSIFRLFSRLYCDLFLTMFLPVI